MKQHSKYFVPQRTTGAQSACGRCVVNILEEVDFLRVSNLCSFLSCHGYLTNLCDLKIRSGGGKRLPAGTNWRNNEQTCRIFFLVKANNSGSVCGKFFFFFSVPEDHKIILFVLICQSNAVLFLYADSHRRLQKLYYVGSWGLPEFTSVAQLNCIPDYLGSFAHCCGCCCCRANP